MKMLKKNSKQILKKAKSEKLLKQNIGKYLPNLREAMLSELVNSDDHKRKKKVDKQDVMG